MVSRQKRRNIKDTRRAILNRKTISGQPAVINKEKRIGDLEAVLMMEKTINKDCESLQIELELITMIDKLQGETPLEVTHKNK